MACFDQFFNFQDVRGEEQVDEIGADPEDSESGDGDGEGGGSSDSQNATNKKKSKSKNKNNLIEEEEEEDLGPGEAGEAKSKLGKLLMANSRVELAMEMYWRPAKLSM